MSPEFTGLTAGGNGDFPCTFQLQSTQHLFTIGDVHGDMLAMLSALALTRCVSVPPTILQKLQVCPTGNDNSRHGFPLAGAEVNSIVWVGGANYVAFLGDILDNRRRSEDLYGNCAMTGTQTQMLELLNRLYKQAESAGGRIIFILGNHDVANMTRDAELGMLVNGCADYAPRYHRVRSNGQEQEYITCEVDENNQASEQFSKEHVDHMLGKIYPMQPVAVARVDFAGAPQSSVLLVHGGLDHRALFGDGDPQHDKDTNLKLINRVYTYALFGNDESAQNILKRIGEKAPTWCRPSFLGPSPNDQFWQSSSRELMAFFGAPSMIKAHDIQLQDRMIRCTSSTSMAMSESHGWRRIEDGVGRRIGYGVPPWDDTIMAPGDLCFIDVGMSRAFGTPPPYQAMHLYTDGSGQLRREVLSSSATNP